MKRERRGARRPSALRRRHSAATANAEPHASQPAPPAPATNARRASYGSPRASPASTRGELLLPRRTPRFTGAECHVPILAPHRVDVRGEFVRCLGERKRGGLTTCGGTTSRMTASARFSKVIQLRGARSWSGAPQPPPTAARSAIRRTEAALRGLFFRSAAGTLLMARPGPLAFSRLLLARHSQFN